MQKPVPHYYTIFATDFDIFPGAIAPSTKKVTVSFANMV